MPAKMMSARGAAAVAGEVSVADSPLASIEALTQAAVVAVIGVAIVVSNLLIISSFLNFKGTWLLNTCENTFRIIMSYSCRNLTVTCLGNTWPSSNRLREIKILVPFSFLCSLVLLNRLPSRLDTKSVKLGVNGKQDLKVYSDYVEQGIRSSQ